MAAISLIPSSFAATHAQVKRDWAGDQAGVILVFAIVFVVGCGIIALFLYRRWSAMRKVKNAHPVE